MNRIVPLLAALLAAGCAGLAPVAELPARGDADGQACLRWFAELDAAVEAAGVRDAGAYRIPGFPHLRADRFTASFRDEAARGAQAFTAWIVRLRELDLAARSHELANLPAAALAGLLAQDARAVLARAAGCGVTLAREDLAAPSLREALVARAVVPDDYDAGVRNSFLYALAAGPFAAGVEDWQREAQELFRRAAGGEPREDALQRYAPAGAPPAPAQVRELLARTPRDALGVPRFSPEAADALLRAYAPQFEIEAAGGHDRFGPLAWKAGRAPEVDPARPVVYRRLAFTRFGGRSLVQLVYTLWFPERPAEHAFDLLSGHLDGVVFRVTLDEQGAPLLADSIHPCGCYHMFFPTPRLAARPAPDPREEWVFVPATLPDLAVGQRLAVRIAARSHAVVAVAPAKAGAALPYAFAEDDELRSLPAADGRRRSAFGADGIIAGTERLESLFFWPMGIASAGAMRQWGRHPTAFVGRRHFDDADLLERRFSLAARP